MPGPTPAAKPKRAASARPGPARAFGRSLTDFRKLSSAEQKLLDCCRRGEAAIIADQRPERQTKGNEIRADIVRFLALGGDGSAPVHEHGVRLQGAWLTGELDLRFTTVREGLTLHKCRIERIDALNANLKLLELDGSRLERGMQGSNLRCEGGVCLRDGFAADGDIWLSCATIGSILDCSSGRFENGGEAALVCEDARIGGSVLLCRGFHARGEVSLSGTIIGGSLEGGGGVFVATGVTALLADRVRVSGHVFLNEGFRALGEVRLPRMSVGGNLECMTGRFENPGGVALDLGGASVSGNLLLSDGCHAVGAVAMIGTSIGGSFICTQGCFENPDGQALTCDFTRVAQAFFFREVKQLEGAVHLSSMDVANLCDDLDSWRLAQGKLVLDGFTYGRIVGSPIDAPGRIAWLQYQYPEYLGTTFRPQPWEQLIGVLRAMGHPNEARTVAIAKQERLRRAGKIVVGVRTLHWLYGLLVGYGYRPGRLLVAIIAVWLFCGAAYWAAAHPGWIARTHLIEPSDQATSETYDSFSPFAYSADVLLPIVDLGYAAQWQPALNEPGGLGLRNLRWLEILLGWLFGGALAAMLGNLIKKD